MNQSQTNQRFVVIGAPTLLDLISGINHSTPIYARLVYFGPNLGNYDNKEVYNDNHRNTKYIAVFDSGPMFVYQVDDIEIVDNDNTLEEVSPNSDVTMSA